MAFASTSPSTTCADSIHGVVVVAFLSHHSTQEPHHTVHVTHHIQIRSADLTNPGTCKWNLATPSHHYQQLGSISPCHRCDHEAVPTNKESPASFCISKRDLQSRSRFTETRTHDCGVGTECQRVGFSVTTPVSSLARNLCCGCLPSLSSVTLVAVVVVVARLNHIAAQVASALLINNSRSPSQQLQWWNCIWRS
jgi:hypothetical protein